MTNTPQTGDIVLIDKPYGWTSFDAVNYLKRRLKIKKAGHAGTLDPLATGLLIVCTGKKTKQIQQLQGMEKEYKAIFLLGAETPSYDLETEVTYTAPFEQVQALRESDIQQCIDAHFTGEVMQRPPLYSAIKRQGKRLYELARQGKAEEVELRPTYIHVFEVSAWNPPHLYVRIVCSKGTYIRSLAHDLGKALGVGGCLTALRRTRIGSYELTHALSPAQYVKQYKSKHESLS